jgi:hypothetical protein
LENFNEWFMRKDLKQLRVIPFLVLWRIWIARNESIFEGKLVPSFQVASQVLSLLPFFQVPSKVPKVSNMLPPQINKSIPWGFLMGPARGEVPNAVQVMSSIFQKTIIMQVSLSWVLWDQQLW